MTPPFGQNLKRGFKKDARLEFRITIRLLPKRKASVNAVIKAIAYWQDKATSAGDVFAIWYFRSQDKLFSSLYFARFPYLRQELSFGSFDQHSHNLMQIFSHDGAYPRP